MQASNATFLTVLTAGDGCRQCVYKPIEGERPLWDFPHRTLGLREVAAYEVSRSGGFDCVPVTVFVDGPLGPRVVAGLGRRGRGRDRRPGRPGADQAGAARRAGSRCVDGLDAQDRPVSVIHADVPDLRLLAVFDVLDQQRRPQGRPHPRQRGPGVRRRSRCELPHRPSCGHCSGAGPGPSSPTRARSCPAGPGRDPGPRCTSCWPSPRSRSCGVAPSSSSAAAASPAHAPVTTRRFPGPPS